LRNRTTASAASLLVSPYPKVQAKTKIFGIHADYYQAGARPRDRSGRKYVLFRVNPHDVSPGQLLSHFLWMPAKRPNCDIWEVNFAGPHMSEMYSNILAQSRAGATATRIATAALAI
jgi:hypothetical protein